MLLASAICRLAKWRIERNFTDKIIRSGLITRGKISLIRTGGRALKIKSVLKPFTELTDKYFHHPRVKEIADKFKSIAEKTFNFIKNNKIIFITALSVFCVDQVSKAVIRMLVTIDTGFWLIPGTTGIAHLTHDTPTVFEPWSWSVLIPVIVFSALTVKWHPKFPRKIQSVIFGAIGGAALGNLFDLVVFGGVTDWIAIGVNGKGIVANIADLTIMGYFLTLWAGTFKNMAVSATKLIKRKIRGDKQEIIAGEIYSPTILEVRSGRQVKAEITPMSLSDVDGMNWVNSEEASLSFLSPEADKVFEEARMTQIRGYFPEAEGNIFKLTVKNSDRIEGFIYLKEETYKGEPILRISYVASAPWNRAENKAEARIYKYVAKELVAFALEYSRQTLSQRRVILTAHPDIYNTLYKEFGFKATGHRDEYIYDGVDKDKIFTVAVTINTGSFLQKLMSPLKEIRNRNLVNKLDEYIYKMNPAFQEALKEGTIQYDQTQPPLKRYRYPFVCEVAARSSKIVLLEEFGSSLKIRVVQGRKQGIPDSHYWVEIEIGDKTYYLSFTDTQYLPFKDDQKQIKSKALGGYYTHLMFLKQISGMAPDQKVNFRLIDENFYEREGLEIEDRDVSDFETDSLPEVLRLFRLNLEQLTEEGRPDIKLTKERRESMEKIFIDTEDIAEVDVKKLNPLVQQERAIDSISALN